MKCMFRYQWVKLPRAYLPAGKGIMGAWARLASRVAFRSGKATYCKYINEVKTGEWVGGIVGLKSILGVRRRAAALDLMDRLSELGFIEYHLSERTKKLSYQIMDWVHNCSGAPCMGSGAVYAAGDYGFICLPRNITQRLVDAHYTFDEADAWLDLWCHTVFQEPDNAFSHMAPAVQFGRYGAVLTLETLSRRWGWEKTKTWRFFQKHADAFPLIKLPGSYGCLIFNAKYPIGQSYSIPNRDEIVRILTRIRILGEKTHIHAESEHAKIAKLVAWYSRTIIRSGAVMVTRDLRQKSRVAHLGRIITRAYFSLMRESKNSQIDCKGIGVKGPIRNIVTRAGPGSGPALDVGGNDEYGRFEGLPLW